MPSFLKFFFASLLALIVFSVVAVFFFIGWVGGVAGSLTAQSEETGSRAVLVVNLDQAFPEQGVDNPLAGLGDDLTNTPGVYDVVRLLDYAKKDSSIKGIYLKCNGNPNGFAVSEEIRSALLDFKRSGKFLVAYGEVIPQKAYYVGSVADRIYCNPMGGVDWRGFATIIPFLKETLQKLEIDPQIFYAGKFKSATEPLRENKMTDANRLQTSELLNDLYNRFLYENAASRNLDTTILRKTVNEHLIQYAADAEKYRLVDGLRYDDQVKDEIRILLGEKKTDKINFVTLSKYADAVKSKYKREGKDRIAVIYAEGDIVGGKGDPEQIGGDTYRALIRKIRMDKDIKALVIRINSGGGDALVSEDLWREITVTRRYKPVVISFGDMAASGAYYLSCNADSIFAEPNTLTGSIGVFTILPNLQQFFKDKLGVTFDGVKTAPDADELTITKPLTDMQKRFLQNRIDSTYYRFKQRVAEGRKKTIDYVDSVGQGRVWSGEKALQLGLVDRLGNLQDAIDCAARMAKTSDYRLKEYPEAKGLLDYLLDNYRKSVQLKSIKEELGEKGFSVYQSIKTINSTTGSIQARIPFDIDIE